MFKEIMLDESGHLHLTRNGIFKKQLCRHVIKRGINQFQLGACGDWCPSFGGVEATDVINKDNPAKWKFMICGGLILYAELFINNRPHCGVKPKEKE